MSENDKYPDVLHTQCDTTFAFWDRVLVLLGWRLQLRLRTPLPVVIAVPCGDTTTSTMLVAPGWWRRLFPVRPTAWSRSHGAEE